MNLYILRHAIAAERASSPHSRDADRPLTPKGKRKMWRVVGAIEALGISFDLVLSSPYLRARQTAEILAERLDLKKKLELSRVLEPGSSAFKLIELLDRRRPQPKNVLLVGHEPYLSSLISLLLAGETGLEIVLKKAALCKLRADSLKPGRCASLEWLLTPKQMALMTQS